MDQEPPSIGSARASQPPCQAKTAKLFFWAGGGVSDTFSQAPECPPLAELRQGESSSLWGDPAQPPPTPTGVRPEGQDGAWGDLGSSLCG